MARIAYVNGRYVPHASAQVHIDDRGYQFADSVYEVCEIVDGMMIDRTGHLDRLDRSLGELAMGWPLDRSALARVMIEVARRNRVRDGLVYVQVSRGVAPRDHPFPPAATRPAIVITARRVDPAAVARKAAAGVAVITVPDNRWERVDIKTTGLLPNVLAKQQALDSGAAEAWLVDADGMVTEGASTNAWIVTGQGTLVTRPARSGILRGITRATVLRAATDLGLEVEERPFSVGEAHGAREAFMTSATSRVMPVVAIDGRPVANGHPGQTAMALRAAYLDAAEKTPLGRTR
ncbi:MULTISPECIES: D-amino-acid transaminase [unclassified Roseitalea]|uniref:D-amino-acid transaminase n=1 Tax=unclassified Roseitalea TaxID=2639107 RepID=UPI00273EC5FE|nr:MULTISPECIES: D-amino-acid transaminase [unclassified Roseitalea]